MKPFYRSLAVTLLLAASVFAQVDTVTPGDNLVPSLLLLHRRRDTGKSSMIFLSNPSINKCR